MKRIFEDKGQQKWQKEQVQTAQLIQGGEGGDAGVTLASIWLTPCRGSSKWCCFVTRVFGDKR